MKTTFRIKYLAILLIFNVLVSFSQNKSAAAEESQLLIKSGVKEYTKGNYIKSLEYFIKVEPLIDKTDYKMRFKIKNTIGICYYYLSNYGEALSIYTEVLKFAEDHDLAEEQVNVMCNIGLLYSAEYDYHSAIGIYEKAFKRAQSINSIPAKTLLAVNIADAYNKLGNYKKAQDYLKSVEQLEMNVQTGQLWKINYAESLLIEGKTGEAHDIMRALEKNNPVDLACNICVMELLSKIYEAKNKIDIAIAYANKGVLDATNKTDKLKLYNQLSLLYSKKKEYDKALQYKDSVIMSKDSVSAAINRGLFETNKVKLKVGEYREEIRAKTEKQQRQNYIFIASIVIVLIIALYIYRVLRHKIARQAQDKIIADKQQQIINLELENLKNSVAEKNRKLSAKTLYLSGRNEILEEIIIALSNIPEVNGNKQIAEYVRSLKGYMKSDAEWDEFIAYFEQANPNFIKKLSSKHPQLNSADLRFICYVLMNLDIREISTIFNITINAATKRKRRIQEKMGIDKEDSLYSYLINLL